MHVYSILQGLNQFLDLVSLDNETGNITFTQKNFGLIALEINTEDEKQQTFNFNETTNASETISLEQLSLTSEPSSGATGSLSPRGLDLCSSGSGSQRIAYSVFRSPGLFLTPETACGGFAIGSIILGVRVPNTNICNASVNVNLEHIEEVKTIYYFNAMWNTDLIFMAYLCIYVNKRCVDQYWMV